MNYALPLLALLAAPPPPTAAVVVPDSVAVLDSVDALMTLVAKQPRAPVIVHFWGHLVPGLRVPRCPRSESFRPPQRLRASHALIGVSMDPKDQTAEVAEFIRREGLSFQNVILNAPDPAPVVRRFDPRWQAELPATFLALQSGVIKDAYHRVRRRFKKMEGQLDQLLAPPASSGLEGFNTLNEENEMKKLIAVAAFVLFAGTALANEVKATVQVKGWHCAGWPCRGDQRCAHEGEGCEERGRRLRQQQDPGGLR